MKETTIAARTTGQPVSDAGLEERLAAVRDRIFSSLEQTTIGSLLREYRRLWAGGKLLRGRLALRVGPAAGVPIPILVAAGAAVELIHAASLLHDDVIDGGYLRRGMPAFWVERGIPGAILLGDLMVFKALELLMEEGGPGRLEEAIRLTREVCEAEAEQELLMRGPPTDWSACVANARRKTGALFAFMASVCGGAEPRLKTALRESGYEIGTAYQLADDVLDLRGDPETAGKTLGRDAARAKATAGRAAAEAGIDPAAFLHALLDASRARLAPWPAVQQAWEEYLALDILPVIERNVGAADGA